MEALRISGRQFNLSTAGHAGINAWEENILCLGLVTGSGKLTRLNQESHP